MSDKLQVDINTIISDITAAVTAIDAVVQFAEKYDSVLPPSLRTAIDEASKALTFINEIIAKINS